MSDPLDLTPFGGTPALLEAGAGGGTSWNFGVLNPGGDLTPAAAAAPAIYDRFPRLAGAWDGKSTVNHHEAARRVLGKDLPAQMQPRGTCGGRAGSRTLELLQCVLIGAGQRAKFHYVSHAWLYYLARRDAGMLRSGDGVPLGSIGDVLARYGALNRDECPDTNPAGPGSDDVAVAWGTGRITAAEAAKYTDLAKDNIVTARVRCKTAQELADGLAAGGIGLCSDGQGYTTTRDAEGFCRPRGTWWHYQVRSGVLVTPRGRRGFAYDQSWGPNMPDGPQLAGWPDNCFGVDWDVQDQLCRTQHCEVLFAFGLWDLDKGPTKLPWVWL